MAKHWSTTGKTQPRFPALSALPTAAEYDEHVKVEDQLFFIDGVRLVLKFLGVAYLLSVVVRLYLSGVRDFMLADVVVSLALLLVFAVFSERKERVAASSPTTVETKF